MTPGSDEEIKRHPSKPFDPLATVSRHWLKIVLLGAVLFIILLPALLLFKKPFYSASGKLLVSPVVPAFTARGDELSIAGYYNSYVQTQVDRIKTPEILTAALKKLPAEARGIFMPDPAPLSLAAEMLGRRLIVTHVAGTHLISITLSGSSPDGLSELINAVMEAYLSQLRGEEEGRDNRRLLYLKKEKDALEQEIARNTQLLNDASREADTSTFSEMHNVHDPALNVLQAAVVRAYERRVEKENALKEARTEVENLKKVSLDPLVEQMVEDNDALSQIDFFTYQTQQQMRSSIDGVSQSNPDRKYIDIRMKGMQDYLDKMRGDIRNRAHTIVYGKRDAEIEQRIIKAESEFREAQSQEQDLIKERDRVEKLKVATSLAILKGQEAEARIDHQRSMLNKIDERLNDLRLESMAPGRISLESPARRPDLPDSEGARKAVTMALLIALAAAAVVCVAFDITDNRIRTRKDFSAAIGARPSWPISNYLRYARPGVAFHRITQDDPDSMVARALNTLTVHLDRERVEHGSSAAVITGVDPQSGVTGIALNVACSMARMCARVLVVDANLLHPQLAEKTGVPVQPDLVALLTESAPLERCIKPAAESGFDILPLREALSREVLAGLNRAALRELLKELRSRYDFIVIDAAPVLAHDLTEYLLTLSDIAVLVVQGDRSLYRTTYMATDILLKLKVAALAPVLNWGAPRQRTQSEARMAENMRRIEKMLRCAPQHLTGLAASLGQFIRKCL
jgi:polysaccharide biosynthesis transport protein